MSLDVIMEDMFDDHTFEEILMGSSIGFVMLGLFEIEEIKDIIKKKMMSKMDCNEEQFNEIFGKLVMQDSNLKDNDKIEILKDLGQI